eukprot:TRINITY_DN6553_c0_g2_i2.p3 TRINITY_DN6553_c0_g2~~TRINITY_DN6553_c0_g2_i2.p3  ORF type:complete len:319 (-),score=63.28 TRINITY_DN6553_c0_g2_i2:240-1196(-)
MSLQIEHLIPSSAASLDAPTTLTPASTAHRSVLSASTSVESSTSDTSADESDSIVSPSEFASRTTIGPLLPPIDPSAKPLFPDLIAPAYAEDEDEDIINQGTFVYRKMAFVFLLSGMIIIAIWIPSMHYDVGYWAVVACFIYMSMDLQTHLNQYFVILTHPISWGLAHLSAVIGGFVMYNCPSLVVDRAEKDMVQVPECWILHGLIYWLPLAMLLGDMYFARDILQKQYVIHLTWPLHDARTRRIILWNFIAAPIVVFVWSAVDLGFASVYDCTEMDSPVLWGSLAVANLFGALVLTYMVRFTSDYYLLPQTPIVVIK